MKEYTGIEYVMIDIANQFGLDKESFAKRIAWVKRNQRDLLGKAHIADKPAQYVAACYALEDALNCVPSGHLVGLDACASGITILGILAGCETTAKNTGVTGSKRMDFYKVCTDAMNDQLQDDIAVSRLDAKQATMTSYYGSKAKPKEIFGIDTDELFAFYNAQEYIAPGACYLMRELLDSWQPYALNHRHTLPDGFNSVVPVLQKCKTKVEIDELSHATLTYVYEENVGSEKGLAVAANITHAIDGFLVRELVRRCNYDKIRLLLVSAVLQANARVMGNGSYNPIEQSAMDHGLLSLRGVEFIDEKNVLDYSHDYRTELLALIEETLAKPRFDVLTVHDEFKCHPRYMNYLRETYMILLAELADSTVGQQIIREVRNDPDYVLTKLTKDLGDKIMKADYFLS